MLWIQMSDSQKSVRAQLQRQEIHGIYKLRYFISINVFSIEIKFKDNF